MTKGYLAEIRAWVMVYAHMRMFARTCVLCPHVADRRITTTHVHIIYPCHCLFTCHIQREGKGEREGKREREERPDRARRGAHALLDHRVQREGQRVEVLGLHVGAEDSFAWRRRCVFLLCLFWHVIWRCLTDHRAGGGAF